MILMLLSALAHQVEPRFTMTAQPGDRVRAELFEVDGGLTDELRQTLLGDAVAHSDSSQELPGWGRARMISARNPDGSLVALSDAPDHRTLGDKVCRVSVRPDATAESVARATRWCASFFDPPVVRIPAPPTSSTGN